MRVVLTVSRCIAAIDFVVAIRVNHVVRTVVVRPELQHMMNTGIVVDSILDGCKKI
jgi:hypothetical protein